MLNIGLTPFFLLVCLVSSFPFPLFPFPSPFSFFYLLFSFFPLYRPFLPFPFAFFIPFSFCSFPFLTSSLVFSPLSFFLSGSLVCCLISPCPPSHHDRPRLSQSDSDSDYDSEEDATDTEDVTSPSSETTGADGAGLTVGYVERALLAQLRPNEARPVPASGPDASAIDSEAPSDDVSTPPVATSSSAAFGLKGALMLVLLLVRGMDAEGATRGGRSQ